MRESDRGSVCVRERARERELKCAQLCEEVRLAGQPTWALGLDLHPAAEPLPGSLVGKRGNREG